MAAVVTLLFTDFVGSTRLLDEVGEDAGEEVRRTHVRLLRDAVTGAGGEDVKNLGDGLMVAFDSPVRAVRCAAAVQQAIATHNGKRRGPPLGVRIGLHVGEPIADEDDDAGTAVVVVAKRLCDAAESGQILASDLVWRLVGSRSGLEFTPLGPVAVEGLAEPVSTYALSWAPVGPSPGPAAPDPRRSPIVGRTAELDALEGELDLASTGRLRTVLLAGDPGMGKTLLAVELAARQGPGVIVLNARAYPLGATASLGLWVEALEGHLKRLSAAEVKALAGPHADDLAALLPTVAGAVGARTVAEPSRVRLLDGLTHLLAGLASDGPLIVVLDDAHLADGSSWEALGYLARNLSGARILLVLAARPAELVDHPIATQTLLALEQEGYLRRLPVGPLTRPDVAALARALTGRDDVGDTLVEWLMERSRGTPLFAVGLVRALIDEGADLARPTLCVLPEDLTQRVALHLRQLDAASRNLVEIAAVVGSRVTLAELVSLCGQPLDTLADQLGRLVHLRLVAELEEGRDLTYELGHPLIQEAVYRGIGGARRRALHRHVARTLIASGRPGPGAAHFVRSADTGDPEAVDALREALAQAEARELHRESLALLEALLDLLPAGDRRWLDVHAAMAPLPEWVVDHRVDIGIGVAAEAMRRVDQLLQRSSDPARRAAVKLNLAVFVGWGEGDTDRAIALAEEARGLAAEAQDRRCELLAVNEIGYLQWIAGDMGQFEARAVDALEGGEAAGDRFVILQGQCALAHNLQLRGDVAGSLPILDRAIALARDDGKLYRTSYLLGQSAYSLGLLGRMGEARVRLVDGQAANPDYRTTVLLDYGMQLDWLAGDLAACCTTFSDQLAWTGGYSRRRALGTCVAAISAAELDDVARARELVGAAAAAAAGRGTQPQSDQMRWAGGVAAWLRGDAPGAVELLAAAGRRQGDGGWAAGPFARFITADLAEVLARTGNPAATRLVAELLAGVDIDRSGPALGGVTQVALGAAALAREALDEAVERLEVAAAALAEAGWPLLHGRAMALAGRAEAAAGRRDRAVDLLRSAVERFDACGATVRRGWALDDLRRLGARGRRAGAAVAGPAALTRREREVVRLAIAGRRAKEIARLLFISDRTVETHLAAAYAKLGISSRVELVRLGPDLDL